MRLLAVNPNTSGEVTEAFLTEARRVAPEGVAIEGVTGRFGARIVTTEAENLIAAHSALDLVARHAAGFDGVILAISFDTALRAVREVLPMPVVGLTEAAARAAGASGRRFGVVTFGLVSLPIYRRLLAGYRFEPVAWDCVEIGSATDYLDPGAKDQAVAAAVERLALQGAEAVVICGAAIVGMAARLAPAAPVPLYDGSAAVAAGLSAVASWQPDTERPRPVGGSVGLAPELAALIAGDWPVPR